jgi:hypothetical protein
LCVYSKLHIKYRTSEKTSKKGKREKEKKGVVVLDYCFDVGFFVVDSL